MREHFLPAVALAALWAGSFVPAGSSEVMDKSETTSPMPASVLIWTDRPGYLRWHDRISVYLATDPRGDYRRYRQFLYLENLETGERKYMVREGGYPQLRDEIVDSRGKPPSLVWGERVGLLPPTKIWGRRAMEPGLWQFVVELRSPDTTEIVKRAHAKFVVSATRPKVIGGHGRDTEIDTDTTWTNDVIYAVRHQVFVNAGATLTIEPGTLILGRGPHAVIVVEKGGRIQANGRPDAPIVMTCDAPVGQRFAGCWGGLVVLGNAPMTRGTGLVEGVLPETRPVYGGRDPSDSSGALRYVRVEFAGSGTASGAEPAGLGLYGVGSGTMIDHVQAHASAVDGILFAGGTANCSYCVSSDAGDDALTWALGWRGTAQHVFLRLSPERGDCAIEGENDELSFDAFPRSAPKLYNLTLIGASPPGSAHPPHGGGILLRSGSAATVRNAVVMGFPAGAIDAWDSSPSLFVDGTSSISNTIVHANGGRAAGTQINGSLEALVGYEDVEPMLVDPGYHSSPDPRPRLYSPALNAGAGAVPPSDGTLDTRAQYIGAFGDSNWLEEWTFLGPESDYATKVEDGREDQQ